MERVPPHNIEAEQAVLSAVLLDNQALVTVMEMLEPDDFYLESHRVLMSCMQEMFEKGMPVDLIILADHLQATGKLEVAGGPAAISTLAGMVSTAANVKHWAGIVKDKSLLRRLITETTSLITEAYDDPEEVEEFLDRAESKVLDIATRQTKTTYQPINIIVQDSFKIIEEFDQRKGAVTGVPSGFNDLDRLTSGFQKSELTILAGRPSMGKTALALNMVRHATFTADYTVAFFSLEMAASQLVMRLICSEARIPFDRLRRGEFKKSQWLTLTNAASTISQAKIYIEDSASLSVLELKAKARRIKSEFGLDMVVVDYLQLLRGLGTKRSQNSREQEIAEISRAMKGMAKELEIPVMALSQLNRAVEQRDNKTPRLSDLRESGSLEQDADLIMFINRPGLYKKKAHGEDEDLSEEDDRYAELIVGKQRNGPIGVVKLTFLKEFTKFEPYEGKYDESYAPELS